MNVTERIVKYIKNTDDDCDLVVNVQGDEPFMKPEHVDGCIKNYLEKRHQFPDLRAGTLHFDIHNESILFT